ncbi:hypothetical protein [Rickettsiales endosymbiont of Stachyamoeba lipophora]|uniref:hypothetical protein n=1 Tax=Rickettsiales endosymbiont of Stachyamoeba lipophora TaxID=2486578 RepID=UPI000F655157|nr:hypothetical protein [Rickettsiales endosymbiont of Stachyamoeba lipophora]AZL15081.1 hypothetical protein EF513_00690 [Rickettsiales endosymbiont of Stachyamoeba lipophora]
MTFNIRKTIKASSEAILALIKTLSRYEQLEDEATAQIDNVINTLFYGHPKVFASLLKIEGQIASFASYLYNYFTFLCKHSIHIEDIYVYEELRPRSISK